MNIIKAILCVSSVEIGYKNRKTIKPACILDKSDIYYNKLKTFDNLDEALEELSKYRSRVKYVEHNRIRFFDVEEYFLEVTYDDSDYPDFYAFSVMQFNVVEEEGYSEKGILGTFNNFADAEREYNMYDGEYDAYIYCGNNRLI